MSNISLNVVNGGKLDKFAFVCDIIKSTNFCRSSACLETRLLSHKARKLVQRFYLQVRERNKKIKRGHFQPYISSVSPETHTTLAATKLGVALALANLNKKC